MPAFLHPTTLPFPTSRIPLPTSLTPRHPPHPIPSRHSRYHLQVCVATTSPSSDPNSEAPTKPPTASSSTSSSSSSKPHNSSEFRSRFGDLRGKPVEPVAATVARFNNAFMRPVPIVYRGIVNELLTTTHLATVCAMWRFDPIFAYGFNQTFEEFLRYYPDDAERDLLYRCCVDALGLDLQVIKDSAAAVATWIEGKTEDDIFTALSEASPGASADSVGPVIEALAYIRDAGTFDWYYSRLFGIGLIQVMQNVGVELSITSAEKWAEKAGVEKSKFSAEMGAYMSSMERLKQAEQIFAEATAREAKKTAERLAARAEAAAKEAEQLESEQTDVKPTADTAEGEPAPQDSSTTSA